MTQNEESSSNMIYNSTWICRFQVPSTFPHGELMEIMRNASNNLERYLQSMLPDCEVSPAILTEPEVDSLSLKLNTPKRSSTKGQSSKNTKKSAEVGYAVCEYDPGCTHRVYPCCAFPK